MSVEGSIPENAVVLLTGAGTGIGLSLARILWSTRLRVIITARSESLSRFKAEPFHDNDRFLIRPLDVCKSDERKAIVAEAEKLWGGIDVLINNAGITFRTVAEHMTSDEELLQLQTNFLAPMELTRLVISGMRHRRRGKIINVSSVGGMMAMPTMGSYSASKYALEGASEALWYELKPWNVGVVLIEPGFIRSESFRHVRCSKRALEEPGEYFIYYEEMSKFIAKLMNRAWATPESVARKIHAVIFDPNPPLRIGGTLDAFYFALLRRLLPQRLYHWILYKNLPGIKRWGNGRI